MNTEKKAVRISWKDKYLDLEVDYNKLLDDYNNEKNSKLYLAAEFDTYKRTSKINQENALNKCKKDFALSLISILEEFERGLSYEPDNEGLKLMKAKFENELNKFDIKKIEVNKGDMFDESLHEAISVVPTNDENMDNTICDIIEQGYKTSTYIVKYTKVIVNKYNG